MSGVVAGIGCRRGCPAEDILALVRRAETLSHHSVAALATPYFKADEAGLRDAAAQLGIALIVVEAGPLEAAQARCRTHSDLAARTTGFASVAEGSALAAAGPDARLVLARITVGAATCALAA